MKKLYDIIETNQKFTLAFITIAFITALLNLYTVLKVLELVKVLKG